MAAIIYYPIGSQIVERNTASGSQIVEVLNVPTNCIFWFDTTGSMNTSSISADFTASFAISTSYATVIGYPQDITGSTLKISNSITGSTLQIGGSSGLNVPLGGNVGIGTTTPVSKLTMLAGSFITPSADSTASIGFASHAAPTTPILNIDTTNGNVGIGTTSPMYNLDVVSTSNLLAPLVRLHSAGSGMIELDRGTTGRMSGVQFSTNEVSNWFAGIYYNGGSAQNQFGIGSDYGVENQKMVITTTGNVGIGTTTPINNLDITTDTSNSGFGFGENGTNIPALKFYRYAGASNVIGNYQIVVGDTSQGYSYGSDMSFKSGAYSTRGGETAITRVTFGGNGNVGIGTTTPTGSLDIQSTTGGLIVPRMTTTQKNGLTAVNGTIVYDTTLNKFQGYESGSWQNLI